MQLTNHQKQIIKKSFADLNSREDLLSLLNKVGKFLYEDKAYTISMKQLSYYANFKVSGTKRFSQFEIPKKSGAFRTINAPSKGLKNMLRLLNVVFHTLGETHEAAHGFVLNKSIADNARPHMGRNYVYNTDLKDFFHSFERKRVKGLLMYPPFNLKGEKEPLAFLIACLCTHPVEIKGEIKYVLPQGSPTSPTLSNLLCRNLDRRLTGLAKRFHLHYTRYADDITFSSATNVFRKPEFKEELQRIIQDQGLQIQVTKTRTQSKGFHQEVTGLTVNEKVNVRRQFIKECRQLLYYWESYGYRKANAIFQNMRLVNAVKEGAARSELNRVLAGKLEFIKMVKGADDPTYAKLNSRFLKLHKSIQSEKLELIVNEVLQNGLEKGLQKLEELKI